MRDAPGWQIAPDEEIIRRVQGGDAKLFSVIFERHYRRLERFVRHMGVPAAEVEDVLGETFTLAFARIRSFNPDSGARYLSYLYAVARNLVTDRLRERGRMPEMLLLEEAWQEPDIGVEAPEDRVLRQEEVRKIRAAMQRLSASDREIVT